MTTLPDYLARAAGIPFARGRADCCMFVADWVLDQTGRDPAADFRNYSDDRGAVANIRQAGGFLEVCTKALESVGLARTDRPCAGDVGVVQLGSARQTLAIKASSGWACKETDGLLIVSCELVAAWSVVDGH